MTDRPMDWDDDRLTAAFAARAEAASVAPPELVSGTIERVARNRRPARPMGRFVPTLGAAAAAVVAVVLGAGQLANPRASAAPSSAGPTTSALSAPPSSSASTADAIVGAPITPGQAIAIRDAAGDNREIAVTGFLGRSTMIRSCPIDLRPRNPTRLGCRGALTWLMDSPEVLETANGSTVSFRGPSGPAIQPSFDLVGFPKADDRGTTPRVTLIGHFDDRRAALCEPDVRQQCSDTFVVDRVAAVDGQPLEVSTYALTDHWDESTQANITETAKDLEEDIDRLALSVAPQAAIVSRQLITIDRVIGLEPILAKDDFVPYVANPATLVWLVTTVDPSGRVPVARTFALFDGSNWFAEVTDSGAIMHERRVASASPSTLAPPVPSADPTAFDVAPTSVLGIPVRDIETLMRDRKADMGNLGRDEFAVRAWYVAPNPATPCQPSLTSPRAPTPPCDEGRHWLVDRPEQLATETGQLRTNPAQWPPVLNPLLPADVPFEVRPTWIGGAAVPQPVIVLGHFADNRVDTYAGNLYFVIDALAWTHEGPLPTLDTVTRLTAAATEDPASVRARIDEVSPNDAVATWMSVVDAADFAVLEPRTAADAPEFTSGAPVWLVRRLIHHEMDGRQRLAIEWAFTADHADRVWMTEMPDAAANLATTLDLGPAGAHTREIRVYDYGQWIALVRYPTSADDLAWQPTNPKRDGFLDVARGATDREVAIRWSGMACAPDWRVLVIVEARGADPPGLYVQPQTYGGGCSESDRSELTRALIITFNRPVDLDAIRSHDGSCCG